jgi:hypothetical protein
VRVLLAALLLGLGLTFRDTPPTLAAICGTVVTPDGPVLDATCVNDNFDALDTALGTVQRDGPKKSLLARSATARSLVLGGSSSPTDPYRAAGLLRGIGNEACGLRQSRQIDNAAFGTIQGSVGDLIGTLAPTDPYKPCLPPNPV